MMGARRLDHRSPGGALVMVLLVVIVIECIVVGTLHLSLQEHRLGANRVALLRLRLDAESGVRGAVREWSLVQDTLPIGAAHRIAIPSTGIPGAGQSATVHLERLGSHVYLLSAEATETAPRAGRASARLLLHPPAIPPHADPAPAPVSSTGHVHVRGTGSIAAAGPPDCPGSGEATFAVLTSGHASVTADPGARIDAPSGFVSPGHLLASLDRIATLAAGAQTPAQLQSGVIIVSGDTVIEDGTFRGLIVGHGAIEIAAGSTVIGAVHAAGDVAIGGSIEWNPCVVASAIAESGLDRPRAAGPRAWIPSF